MIREMRPPGTNPLRIGAAASSGVLNIAHRGARAFAPENTLPAFAKAVAMGCSMFELDVHMSKDGELVVHHDDRLARCTDVAAKFPNRRPYYLSDFTFSELRTLDAGSWFGDELSRSRGQRQSFLQGLTDEETEAFVRRDDRRLYASGAVQLPSLREALEFAKQAGVMVDIELKTLPRMYDGLADALVRLIASMQMQESVLVTSFDHEQLVAVRALSNTVALGALVNGRLGRPADYLRLLDADAYLPNGCGKGDSLGFGSVSGELDLSSTRQVREAGGHVMVWTCNDPGRIERLVATGVTGIISDYPNRVGRVLGDEHDVA
jgi:glycerophosphoryl diester phosphodiesterase